jgi:hypothetical protein
MNKQDLITPEQYDLFERSGISELPIPILMAFQPVTFERYSYPTRIFKPRDVLRYADHNCEPEVAGLFKEGATFDPVGYVNSFTLDEFELLDKLRGAVSEATLNDFGRAVRPVSNLLAQTGPFRVMSHLARFFSQKSISLFEVGPGAGYLGALMAVAGHKYFSYDITQSLYIWQQYLLRTVAPDDFFDTAQANSFEPPTSCKVVHLPWWQYVRMLHQCPIRSDVVYSNSNLGEMSPVALKQVLHISRKMLQGSDIGLFYYFSTGMTAQNSPEQLAAAFVAAGYRLVFEKPFMAYVLQDRDPSFILEAFREGIPFHDPSGRGGRHNANEVMALKRSEAPLDAEFAKWQYGWQPPYTD